MIILDSTNGGYGGVTTKFWTTDLSGNEVVRRHYKALQGGYVIPNEEYGSSGSSTPKNKYEIIKTTNSPTQLCCELENSGYYSEHTATDFFRDSNQSVSWSYDIPATPYFGVEANVFGLGQMLVGNSYEMLQAAQVAQSASLRQIKINIIKILKNENFGLSFYISNDEEQRPITPSGYFYVEPDGVIPEYWSDLNIYDEILKIDSVFYCDNVENLSDEKILKRFGINKLTKSVDLLAEPLVERGFKITSARKIFVFFIKNDEYIDVLFYRYGFCGSGSKTKKIRFKEQDLEGSELYFFEGMDLAGFLDINAQKYDKLSYERNDDWFKITSDSDKVVTDIVMQNGNLKQITQHPLVGFMSYFHEDHPVNSIQKYQYTTGTTGSISKSCDIYTHIVRFVPLSEENMLWREENVYN